MLIFSPMNRKDAHWDETAQHPYAGKLEGMGRRLLYGCASLFLKPEPRSSFSLKKIERLLVIKEPYRMGDLLQITPTLRALKKQNPSLRIDLVIQDRNFLIFQDNPDVDEIFLYRKREFNKNFLKLASFLKDIRRGKFDAALTLETERTHLTNDLIAYFSGAPYRVRYDGSALGNQASNAFYNVLVPFNYSAVHQVDKNFGVFEGLGLRLEDPSLVLTVTEENTRKAKEILRPVFSSLHMSPEASFMSFHPGSYKLNNRWPLGNYLEAARTFKERGKTVLFLLGPSESGWKEEIEREGFPVVAGISILEMAAILKLSEQVLCNDTGVMHISAAVGAKTLALFGETEPDLWKPPGEGVKALRSPDKKISSIRVEEVVRLLGQ